MPLVHSAVHGRKERCRDTLQCVPTALPLEKHGNEKQKSRKKSGKAEHIPVLYKYIGMEMRVRIILEVWRGKWVVKHSQFFLFDFYIFAIFF